MDLKINTILRGGTYRILKKLGQGSFGITYLAEHTELSKKVAIKEFFMKDINSRTDDGSITGITDGSFSYNYSQKFKREALNLAKLEHPNIVRVTDCFDENNTYYYVMDFIEGENLNDYLKSHTIREKKAVAIIKDVASALTYMHDQHHMLHLDLKPGNIMRRASDGHIFLIDFGLSKHYNNNGQPETSTTIGLGTQGYAPIEQSNQARSGEFRPTIDVYALGATLYKLLTGETPPAASDVVADKEIVSDKLNENGISQSITNLIMAAMEPIAKMRIPTVNEFSRRLAMINLIPTAPKGSSGFSHNNESTRIADEYFEETKVYPETNMRKDAYMGNQATPHPVGQPVGQPVPQHPQPKKKKEDAYTGNQATPPMGQPVPQHPQPKKKKSKWWLWLVIGFVATIVIIAIIAAMGNSQNTTQVSSLTSSSEDINIMQQQEFNNYIAQYNNYHANRIQLVYNNQLEIHFPMQNAALYHQYPFAQFNNTYFNLDNRFLNTLRSFGSTITIYFYDPNTGQGYDSLTFTNY